MYACAHMFIHVLTCTWWDVLMCVYTCMCLCTCLHVLVCVHTYACTHVYVCMHTSVPVCSCVYLWTLTCVLVCVHVLMCVCVSGHACGGREDMCSGTSSEEAPWGPQEWVAFLSPGGRAHSLGAAWTQVELHSFFLLREEVKRETVPPVAGAWAVWL